MFPPGHCLSRSKTTLYRAEARVCDASTGRTRLLNVMVWSALFVLTDAHGPSLAKSSLPVVRHAVHNERVAADNRMDRMAIWMRNVERMFVSC